MHYSDDCTIWRDVGYLWFIYGSAECDVLSPRPGRGSFERADSLLVTLHFLGVGISQVV
jgi:hypothetical protein